jgi:GntR family transcriptional regulator, transcriptional repressor for pyruvate dehydrogenase complex
MEISMQHSPEKISEQVINHIRDLILSGDLKPGDRLGSDKELMVRFNVSKATLREALRVLEVMRLINIRKGKTGGVFVAQVDMRTTLNSLMAFLRFEAVPIKNITVLRYLLEPAIVEMVIGKLEEPDIRKLEEIIGQSIEEENKPEGIDFHRYLARMTRNRLLILLMDFIDSILSDLKIRSGLDDKFYDQVRGYHQNILSCLTRNDVLGAREAIITDVLFTGDVLAASLHEERFDPRAGSLSEPSVMDGQAVSKYLYSLADSRQTLPELLTAKGPQSGKLLLQQIGTGRIYLVDLSGDDEDASEVRDEKNEDKGVQNMSDAKGCVIT